MIQKDLENILKGKTVLICAHRLSSITSVDKIHVLKDGKVMESGTHFELMNNQGISMSDSEKNNGG